MTPAASPHDVDAPVSGGQIGAEALALAQRRPRRVRNALSSGFAGSRILELHGQRMIDDDFRPGGRATTQRKDLAEIRS